MKIFFLTLLSFLAIGCNVDVKYVEETAYHAETNVLLLPYYEPDTVYQDDPYLFIEVTDSKPYFNSTEFEQMVFCYSYQLHIPNASYDSIIFKMNMPNRPDGGFESVIPAQFAIDMRKKLSNTIFENFLYDLLILNLETQNDYSEYTSLLFSINTFFSKQIDLYYPEEYPNNSTWYGYNSFNIFEQYFIGIYTNEQNTAISLIDSLYTSKNYLNENDVLLIKELIKNYEQKFLDHEE